MKWFLNGVLAIGLAVTLLPIQVRSDDSTVFDQLGQKLGVTVSDHGIALPVRVFIRPTGAMNVDVAINQARDLAGSLAALSGHFEVLERSEQSMRDGIREQLYNMSELVDKSTAVKIGNAKGAQAIVYLRTRPVGLQEELTAWIYMIENGQHLPNVSMRRSMNRSAGFGAARSLVLPGWGQWACGKKGAGSTFFLSAVGLSAGAVYAQGQANSARDDAVLATNASDRDRLVKDADDWQSKRNLLFAGVGAVWITNVLHASWISARTPITASFNNKGNVVFGATVRF